MAVNIAYHWPKRLSFPFVRWFPRMKDSALPQTPPIAPVDGQQAYEEYDARMMSDPHFRAVCEREAQKMDLWLQLVEARMASGLTPKQMAKQMNIKVKEVLRFEEAGYDCSTLDVFYAYAEVLGFNVKFTLEPVKTGAILAKAA